MTKNYGIAVLVVIVVIIGSYLTFPKQIEAPTGSPTASPWMTSTSEPIGATYCTPDQRKAEVCTAIYAPVCGAVEVQCIKAPCYPVPQTFSNACTACANPLVQSYTAGECR